MLKKGAQYAPTVRDIEFWFSKIRVKNSRFIVATLSIWKPMHNYLKKSHKKTNERC